MKHQCIGISPSSPALIRSNHGIIRGEKNVQIPQPVTTVYTGKCEHPQKYISPELLHEAMSAQRRITVSKLAHLLKVSCPTLIAHLKKHKVDYKF